MATAADRKPPHQVSFALREGEIFGLIGPNGAGKTTRFNLVSGMTPASGGLILWRGGPITALLPHRRNRLGLARTFPNLRLFDGLTMLLVQQNANAALAIVDRGVVLEAGRFSLQGTAERLRADEGLRASSLGD